MTCAMCLIAPEFMVCGWCSGECSWEEECSGRWRNESCPPGITEVRRTVERDVFVLGREVWIGAISYPTIQWILLLARFYVE